MDDKKNVFRDGIIVFLKIYFNFINFILIGILWLSICKFIYILYIFYSRDSVVFLLCLLINGINFIIDEIKLGYKRDVW